MIEVSDIPWRLLALRFVKRKPHTLGFLKAADIAWLTERGLIEPVTYRLTEAGRQAELSTY